MKKIFNLLFVLLTEKEKKKAFFVLVLMILVAASETIGVASIIPFIYSVTENASSEKTGIILFLYNVFNKPEDRDFTLILGGCFVLFLLITLILKTIAYWSQVKFAKMRVHLIGVRFLERYLYQSYAWFLNQHTSRLCSTILSEINQVVGGALFPQMQVLAHSLIAMALFGFIFMVDPILALSAVLFLGSTYGVIYIILRKPLLENGKKRYLANQERYRIAQEIFGGIKDIKGKGLEPIMRQRFENPSYHTANQEVKVDMMKQLPSYFMQGTLTVGMVITLLYLQNSRGSLTDALPDFAAFAYAGYRLMPSLQQIYRNATSTRSSVHLLEVLVRDYISLTENIQKTNIIDSEKISLNKKIELINITYSYPKSNDKAIDTISLEIPAKSTIGIVGTTGSGKTTLVDIVLGLLNPQNGEMYIDNKIINESNIRGWQKSVGYVPQQIFLADETIAGNIAFGIPENEIDIKAVESAAKIANLHEFVTEQLSHGYNSTVGEKGVRLSGGQRQRIGIARALYHSPDLIIMDEATSALDNITENAVMKAVENMANQMTIILIAHRLTTVQSCDVIYLLENGQIKASGTYEELLEKSTEFRNLSQVEKGSS